MKGVGNNNKNSIRKIFVERENNIQLASNTQRQHISQRGTNKSGKIPKDLVKSLRAVN